MNKQFNYKKSSTKQSIIYKDHQRPDGKWLAKQCYLSQFDFQKSICILDISINQWSIKLSKSKKIAVRCK